LSLTNRDPAAPTFERIDKEKAALLIIDHQVGLFQLVRDWSSVEYKNNVLAFSALGNVFNLPVVMTTSAESGAYRGTTSLSPC
jgi:nicotinamidase-related amidase